MIIFNLDGVLADNSHRRHFIESKGSWEWIEEKQRYVNHQTGVFKEKIYDFESYESECNKDKPIEPIIKIFESLMFENHVKLGMEIEIWTDRFESLREKTEKWLEFNVWGAPSCKLKIRPVDDTRPECMLKELWLDEYIDAMW